VRPRERFHGQRPRVPGDAHPAKGKAKKVRFLGNSCRYSEGRNARMKILVSSVFSERGHAGRRKDGQKGGSSFAKNLKKGPERKKMSRRWERGRVQTNRVDSLVWWQKPCGEKIKI